MQATEDGRILPGPEPEGPAVPPHDQGGTAGPFPSAGEADPEADGETILVAAEDLRVHGLVERSLSAEGHRVLGAVSGTQTVRLAREHRPRVVLVDERLPGDDPYELCRWLRSDWRYGEPSIVMLVAESFSGSRALSTAADEFLVKPIDPVELVARVRATLRRAGQIRSASPLTSLPGNVQIERELRRRMAIGEKVALLYVDLDDFKAYNDHYGFLRGDRALRRLAECLRAAAERRPGTFLGHVGGDDFVILADPELAAGIVREAVTSFRSSVAGLYDPKDAARGWIEVEDRYGKLRRIGLLSISIGVVSNLDGGVEDHWVLVETATDMKERAKRVEGNAVAVDRRAGTGLRAELGGSVDVLGFDPRRSRRRPGRRSRWTPRALAAALVAAAMLAGPGVALAENARPGDLLWPAKLRVEELRLAVAAPDRRADLHLEFAGRRLSEIPGMLRGNPGEELVAEVTENLRVHTRAAMGDDRPGAPAGAAAASARIVSALEQQVGVLEPAAAAACRTQTATICTHLRNAHARSRADLAELRPDPEPPRTDAPAGPPQDQRGRPGDSPAGDDRPGKTRGKSNGADKGKDKRSGPGGGGPAAGKTEAGGSKGKSPGASSSGRGSSKR